MCLPLSCGYLTRFDECFKAAQVVTHEEIWIPAQHCSDCARHCSGLRTESHHRADDSSSICRSRTELYRSFHKDCRAGDGTPEKKFVLSFTNNGGFPDDASA